jgi:hypothetical protein
MTIMKTTKNQALLLTAVIALGFLGMESCKKSNNNGPTPPPLIGGFASSDSVEPQALVAYWPLDGDVNDHKGGINGTGVNVTYTTGVRGQAYQGSSTSYASFTPNATLQGLQSFSLTLWYWQTAQPVDSPKNDPEGMFFLADANANPDIIVENEHYAPKGMDSVQIHEGTYFPNSTTNYKGFTMTAFDTAAIGKWVHFAITYDAGSSTWVVYQNGQPTGNQSAFGTSASTILLNGPTGTGTPMGNPNWMMGTGNAPTAGTIGTWAPGVYGVSTTLGSNGNWQGKLDEIRIYNIALTNKDVAGLYLNGQAGR